MAKKELKPKERTRKDIKKGIDKKMKQLDKTKAELIELHKENCLLCDDQQWFTEKKEKHVHQKTKKAEMFLVGRVHWKETITKDDKPVEVVKSQVVKINGEWK